MELQNFSREQLNQRLNELNLGFEKYKAMGLRLDMSRGKPGTDQLELSQPMLEMELPRGMLNEDGFDTRNYGLPDGIPECKRLFADLLGVEADNVIVFGNASLTIMYDYIAQCYTHGAGSLPWAVQGKIKFICPVPGYDRHFAILERFGIEMLNVPMLDDGPDMDMIENLIRDPLVKGIICVPKYSNPTGITFSGQVVRRFAALRPAADDFRVIWDNAYFVHDIGEKSDTLPNIFDMCKEYGTEDYFIEVTSTSKITFPGAGVSALAASRANIKAIKSRMSIQTICHDKINQLRHACFLKDSVGTRKHMKHHARILEPKFNVVLESFERNFAGKSIARWTKPNGGYFISLDVPCGCAKRTVELCRQAGVTLTDAGATFPYHTDPNDCNIRIAPTYPHIDELREAVEILCLCVEMAAIEKLVS